MSLRLIIGNSGSGKSYQTYREIITDSLEHPERNYLVIVPEQFTMQTQKELVSLHPRKGILNIDVLSFQRLAYRIFEEIGTDRRAVLEETGKSLLLRKGAIEHKDELKVLGRNLEKSGYIKEVKSVISELKQYDVSVDEMEALIGQVKAEPQLYYKLQDIQILYRAFQEKLKAKYITSEETLDVLAGVIRDSGFIKNSVIVLDEFTGFTPIQQKLIQELLIHSRDVSVTVTMDVREDPWRVRGMHELFYLSKKTIHTLTELAKAAGVSCDEPRILADSVGYRFREAPALRFLEANLLRGYPAVYPETVDGISIHTARNVVQEAHFAARTICRLIREEHYRYQDIAIVTGDITAYSSYISRVFAAYQIPVFIDTTKQILLNPFLEFIRAALEVAERNYSYESIFRLLRTGLCDVANSDIDRMENYVLAAGIRGISRWEEAWSRTTRTIDETEVLYLDEIRARLTEQLVPFTKQVKSRRTTVAEKTAALYRFIAGYQIQEKLMSYEVQFQNDGQLDRAKEYGQIYRIVIELLEKTVELLGDEKLTIKEYIEILEAGFSEAKVGMIPPTTDRIVVGDIQRTRLKNIRTLIFLGLNDGWVPKAADKMGLLSELDRERLQQTGTVLAPGSRENSYIQRFYLYLILTKPCERLFLSYSKSSMDGSAMRPSYVIGRILKMFPKVAVCDEERERTPVEQIVTPENGIDYLLAGLQRIRQEEPPQDWQELYSWYQRDEQWQDQVAALVEAAFFTRQDQGIGRTVAKVLYGEVLENSVSRLERFAGCAFAHFIQYGLHLNDREEFSFQPVDLGNVVHKVIEIFSKRLEQSEYTWFDVPEDVREAWTTECVEEAAAEYGGYILTSNARNEYVIRRIERIMKRTIWALTKQVRAGMFIPRNYEVSFSVVEDLKAVNITLGEDEKMRLKGRIDRVDTCDTGDAVYVKVIDYKSGNTGFDMVAVYYGLQLQLVVYLNAAMELEKRISPEKEILPAGVFYYRTNDPIIDRKGEATPEEINDELLKELKLNGLVNADPDVAKSMDTGMDKKSNIIPVSYNKDGSPSRFSSVATNEQFSRLSSYVNQKIKDIGSRIIAGETAAVPYERKGGTACDYCEYQAICSFDTRIPGNQFKRLKEYKTDEVWQQIDREVTK